MNDIQRVDFELAERPSYTLPVRLDLGTLTVRFLPLTGYRAGEMGRRTRLRPDRVTRIWSGAEQVYPKRYGSAA